MAIQIIMAIVVVILSIIGIVALASILEILKIVAVVIIVPFSFLWFWAFLKENFKLDEYIAIAISLVISVAIGIFIYQSWWAIMILSIVLTIGYFLWKWFTGLSISDVMKLKTMYKKKK